MPSHFEAEVDSCSRRKKLLHSKGDIRHETLLITEHKSARFKCCQHDAGSGHLLWLPTELLLVLQLVRAAFSFYLDLSLELVIVQCSVFVVPPRSYRINQPVP